MNILFIDFSHKKQQASETANLYYSIAVSLRSRGCNLGLLLLKTSDKPAGFDSELYNLGCYLAEQKPVGLACRKLGNASGELETLREIRERLSIDLLHVCTLGVERHGELLAQLEGAACIDCHDCASRHRFREWKHDFRCDFKRMPKAFLKLIYDLGREFTILRNSRHERVYTLVSGGDQRWFRLISPMTQSAWIQPHIIPFGRREGCRDVVEPFTIGIWGVSGVWNEDALKTLVFNILPRIKKRFPESRVKVFGNISKSRVEQYIGCRDVVFEGFAEDLCSCIQTCEICCFPYRYGSGIKTKLLECMNWGVPCITSKIGSEGLREDQLKGVLIGRSERAIAESCISLFENKDQQTELVQRGFEVIDEGFSSKNAIRSYLEAYEKVLSRSEEFKGS